MSTNNKRPPEAFVSKDLFELGMGHVIVSRFKGSDMVESGVFLLDVFCLGVKNAFFTKLTIGQYEDELLKQVYRNAPPNSMEPSCARKLVEDAVAYAQNLGFSPHPDYKKACRVLGGISSKECTTQFTFGKDGKPLFIQGPHDSEEKCQRILKQLQIKQGQDQFTFMVNSDVLGITPDMSDMSEDSDQE